MALPISGALFRPMDFGVACQLTLIDAIPDGLEEAQFDSHPDARLEGGIALADVPAKR